MFASSGDLRGVSLVCVCLSFGASKFRMSSSEEYDDVPETSPQSWFKNFVSNADIVWCVKSIAKGLQKGIKGNQAQVARDFKVVSAT